MKKHIYDYLSSKKDNKFVDIDFHHFIEMRESGLSDKEISNELGVPKSYVSKLMDDYRNEY